MFGTLTVTLMYRFCSLLKSALLCGGLVSFSPSAPRHSRAGETWSMRNNRWRARCWDEWSWRICRLRALLSFFMFGMRHAFECCQFAWFVLVVKLSVHWVTLKCNQSLCGVIFVKEERKQLLRNISAYILIDRKMLLDRISCGEIFFF